MLTCKEVSFLASKRLDNKLTWRENLGFRMHIMMCSLCRRYANEIKKMHGFMRKAGKSGLAALPDSVKLSSESRERIKQAINKVLHQAE